MLAGNPPIHGGADQCCSCHRGHHASGGGGLGVQYGSRLNQLSPGDIAALRLAVEDVNKTLKVVIERFGPLCDSGVIGSA